MSLTVNTNLAAIAAYNNLSATDTSLSDAIQKLSSGKNVSTAADDAAGYVVSQELTQQANGYAVAISNAQNGVSVLQTAQGALNQISAILQKMSTLALQAANDGASDSTAQGADDAEFQALSAQIDQIAKTTTFGQKKLLDGTYSGTFQVGPDNDPNEQINVTINNGTAGTGLDSTGLALTGASLASATTAQAAIDSVKAALSTVSTAAGKLGAVQNEMSAIVTNLTVGQQNLQAANSQIVDTNMASEMTTYTSESVLEQAGVAMLAHAQQNPTYVLKLLQ